VLRLSPAGGELTRRLAAGQPVPDRASPAARRLIRRLLDAGLAHPRPPQDQSSPAGTVAAVIPVRDRAAGLERTLACLDGEVDEIVVVDDGSAVPLVCQRACQLARQLASRPLVRVLRHPSPRGPAAARNTGWRAVSRPVVAFLDADCEPEQGWLEPLLRHLGDPAVGAVAPRVAALPRPEALARYERRRSPLDMGAREAPVRLGSSVPYVPSAALVVRRQALSSVNGFDEALSVGEDVDLIWRLTGSGWRVRYDPSSTVVHPPRPDLWSLARQRFAYGSSAGPLARRHPQSVPPLAISGWALAAWALSGLGRPLPALAMSVAATGLLARRLHGVVPHPVQEAARLAARAQLQGGRALARAVAGPWWPLAAAAAASRRARPAVLLAAAVPPLVEWVTRRPALDPARWLVLHVTDDLCYGAGVWAGCWRARTVRPLVPRILTWPAR
jgi:mycofactocin system glycosyltransferase